MRRKATSEDPSKPVLNPSCYYSKTEALEINERSRELCSAAAKISRRAARLAEASRELQLTDNQLLRELKARRR